ncbi:hypothetical protein E5676_scaffold775G00290 [Cucumis melo var. makuwa]|uniref:Uncharacterized protein n=1 Tax=Cucumis melo var. makuwa TaxID=1194695 RepID=A0A5D3BU02_CUCMM|nr:hypothetical protein E5676_scaffold775G00290 [Cucumis melo var. makuwa]
MTPPSAIHILLVDYRIIAVRSTTLEPSGIFIIWRGDSAVSDPPSTSRRSNFCRQIHRRGRCNQELLSFREETPPSTIQLLLGDDRAFYVRSIILVRAIGHLRHLERIDWATLSLREMTPQSTIQLLLGDDRAFADRSTALVGAIERLRRLERGDSIVSDPTSTIGRSGFYHQMHRLCKSDRALSLFGEVTPQSAIQLLLGDDRAFAVRSVGLIGAIRHLLHFKRSTVLIGVIGAPSSFREVTPPSAIQLLLGDNRAFTVRSTALVRAIRHLCHLER